MSKSITLVDVDGAELGLNGRPLRNPAQAGYPADIVEVRVGVSESSSYRAWISARELAAAIEEVTGVKPEASAEPEPELEPLWTEVRERPARAVEITPELVRQLADIGRVQAELPALEAEFDRATGAPVGVGFYDPRRYETTSVPLGKYVVLRPGQLPQVVLEDEFERLFEVAT